MQTIVNANVHCARLVVGLYPGQFPFIICKLPPWIQTMTAKFAFLSIVGVHTFRNRLSSLPIKLPELSMLRWIHVLPNIDALNVPDQQVLVLLLSDSGGFHRRCVVGSNAYGIPLKSYDVEWISWTCPQCVFTIGFCATLSTTTLDLLNAQNYKIMIRITIMEDLLNKILFKYEFFDTLNMYCQYTDFYPQWKFKLCDV